jgi:phage shock protein B
MDASFGIPLMVFGFVALVVIVIVLGVIAVVWLVVRASTRSSGAGLNKDEMRMVQEIHLGLKEMEKRVESLETILLGSMKER